MALTARLTALVVALTLGLPLTSAPVDARPAPPPRVEGESWHGLDVWHFSAHGITFRGNEMPYPRPGAAAIAATADAAIVQLFRYRGDSPLGRLVELPATGAAGRTLDRHPLGAVLADPNGHVAFWSSQRPDGAHLVALDTTTGTKVIGPRVRSRMRVFAVEGATAYVVDLSLRGPLRTFAWTPGQAALTELPRAFGGDGLLSDVSGDRVLSMTFRRKGLRVTDRAGTRLRTLPLFSGTFSPDGAHVAGWGRRSLAVHETETGRRVPLGGLHGRFAATARWSPHGLLIVDTIPGWVFQLRGGPGIVSFVCDPADGDCRRLRGRARDGVPPPVTSDALGQLLSFGLDRESARRLPGPPHLWR